MEDLTWERIVELGKVAYESGLFRDIKNPEQAIIKMLKGRELGVTPVTALESIFIIDGRVALSAGLIASRIKNSGKYDYKTIEKSHNKAVIEFYEGGKKVGESSFGIEDAKRAGILDTWGVQKYPDGTFWARALTSGARAYCPDVFMGGSIYVVEELIKNCGSVESNVDEKDRTKLDTDTGEKKPEEKAKLITKKQVNYLWFKSKEKGVSSAEFIKMVKDNTGKGELDQLTYQEFNKILGLINAM